MCEVMLAVYMQIGSDIVTKWHKEVQTLWWRQDDTPPEYKILSLRHFVMFYQCYYIFGDSALVLSQNWMIITRINCI